MSAESQSALSLEIMAAAKRLEHALREGDLDQVADSGFKLQQKVIFVAHTRNREELRLLSRICMELARLAFAQGNGKSTLYTVDGWGCRLQVLAEAAAEHIVQDQQGSTEEALKYLETRGELWQRTVQLAGNKALVTAQEIQIELEGMAGWENPRQACDRHISRMIKAGFLHRVKRGFYRLSGTGLAVLSRFKVQVERNQYVSRGRRNRETYTPLEIAEAI